MGRRQLADKPKVRTLEDYLELAKNNDNDAKTQVILLTKTRFYKFCVYTTGNPHTANDLFQEAYIKAFAKLGSLTETQKFLPWLCQLARNLYLDSLKLKSNQTAVDFDSVATQLSFSGPDLGLSISIQKVLAEMEPEDRMVLVLIDMMEYSYDEAAQTMNTTEPSVRSRLHRARKLFADLYRKRT